ncbi:ABC transporter substrate-binding protein [Streptomyces sp. NPDC052721]|uniref:ABC transporter substrate-binding protein n=1 Tax=Streptomyces sp. NPDC052721 TaxID=3154955 RepID=UPI00342212C4
MKLRLQWSVLPFLVGAASVLVTGCGVWPDGGSSDSRIVVGMSDSVLATDPASGYDPGSWLLFNNVFQSLLSFPQGRTEPQPEAAERCSFTDKHAKVYRCTLRDGLKFSNGDPLTAEDVKFSFDRMLRIDDPAGPAVMFRSLDRVETPDIKTVIFYLNDPDATFPSKIASGAGSIVDRRQYDMSGLRDDGRAVGSGPYVLESFGKDEAVFSVNKNYKGHAKVRNSGITLKFFSAGRTALKQAVIDGRVDIAYRGLLAGDIARIGRLRSGQDIKVVEGDSAEVQHLVFNMNDPVAGKLGVRRAIAYLLDRDALIRQVFQDTAVPLYSIVPAGIGGHNTAFFDTYGGRPSKDKAAAALRAEGIQAKVRLTLWSTPSRYGPATDQEMRAIAAQLNASGLFQADTKSVPFDRYEKEVAAGKYGVYVKGWVPDYPDADNFTVPFFAKENVLGNHYSNSVITDTLIPITSTQSNRRAADREFAQIQDIVAEQLPVLPVWQGKQYAVVRKSVHGVEYCLDSSTVFRFWELSKY